MTYFQANVDPFATTRQSLGYLNDLQSNWKGISGDMSLIEPALKDYEDVVKVLTANSPQSVVSKVDDAFTKFRATLETHSTFSRESLLKKRSTTFPAKPMLVALPAGAKPAAMAEPKYQPFSDPGKLRISNLIKILQAATLAFKNLPVETMSLGAATAAGSATTAAGSKGGAVVSALRVMLPPASGEQTTTALNHMTNWGSGAAAASATSDVYIQHPKGVQYCNKAKNVEIDIHYDEDESKERGLPCYVLTIEGKSLRLPVMLNPQNSHFFVGSAVFTFSRLPDDIIMIEETDTDGTHAYYVDISIAIENTAYIVYPYLPQVIDAASAVEALKLVPAQSEPLYAAYNKHGVVWFGYDSKSAAKKTVFYWAPPGVKCASKVESVAAPVIFPLEPTQDQVNKKTEHVKVYSLPNVIFTVTSIVTIGSNQVLKRTYNCSINSLRADRIAYH
jgi:hypothetical protein